MHSSTKMNLFCVFFLSPCWCHFFESCRDFIFQFLLILDTLYLVNRQMDENGEAEKNSDRRVENK